MTGDGYPPPYGYAPPRRTNSTAIASLVVALASVFVCGLAGAVAVYLGHRARTEIARTGEDGDGLALAALIVGWVSVALSLMMIIALIGFIAINAA